MTVGVAVGASIVGSLVLSGPANAGSENIKCAPLAADGRKVCVNITTDDSGYREVWGYITPSGTYSRNVAVQQCDGNGNNCGAYSATAMSDTTTPKPVILYHTYKATASWKDSSGGSTVGPYTTPLAA